VVHWDNDHANQNSTYHYSTVVELLMEKSRTMVALIARAVNN
jgi:hypothetical protein